MNLLVTGAWQGAKDGIEQLKTLGHQVEFLQFEKDELPCSYEWVEGVICNGLFLSHPIKRFTHLKYIQLTSAGFDRVDMQYVKKHNIEIHNARGVYSIPMAEFAIFGVLELYKQGKFFQQNQAEKRWEKQRNLSELFGKQVCIAGCGNVGTECAKRFSAFGCRITGVDLYPREDENYGKMVGIENLSEVLSKSDIVILTLPLTKETRHLMNEEKFSQMKDGAILVNIARGAVVDTEALKREMPRLGGAVLDVFEEEPLGEDSPLWEMEKVIVTPHNSFVGDGNARRLAGVIYENIRRELSDKYTSFKSNV